MILAVNFKKYVGISLLYLKLLPNDKIPESILEIFDHNPWYPFSQLKKGGLVIFCRQVDFFEITRKCKKMRDKWCLEILLKFL